MGWTVGRAAAEAGVHVETIRYYERRGLIERPPKPANGGYRTYPETTVARVRFIRRAQSLGFPLNEVGTLLTLRGAPDGDCSDVRARAIEQLERIDAHMAELARKRTALAEVLERCPGKGELCQCAILNAFEA